MNDSFQIIAAFVGAGALGLGLVSLFIILTFAFSRVSIIEEKISRPGTSALEHRKIWGNDPLGRLMRSGYVFSFLVLRSSPSSRLNRSRSEEHTSELQSRPHLVCRLLLEKKKKI